MDGWKRERGRADKKGGVEKEKERREGRRMDGRWTDEGREEWERAWMDGNYSEGKQETLLAPPGQRMTDRDDDETREHLCPFSIPLLSPKVRSWTLRSPVTIGVRWTTL